MILDSLERAEEPTGAQPKYELYGLMRFQQENAIEIANVSLTINMTADSSARSELVFLNLSNSNDVHQAISPTDLDFYAARQSFAGARNQMNCNCTCGDSCLARQPPNWARPFWQIPESCKMEEHKSAPKFHCRLIACDVCICLPLCDPVNSHSAVST